jgi:hypothetical protein
MEIPVVGRGQLLFLGGAGGKAGRGGLAADSWSIALQPSIQSSVSDSESYSTFFIILSALSSSPSATAANFVFALAIIAIIGPQMHHVYWSRGEYHSIPAHGLLLAVVQ